MSRPPPKPLRGEARMRKLAEEEEMLADAKRALRETERQRYVAGWFSKEKKPADVPRSDEVLYMMSLAERAQRLQHLLDEEQRQYARELAERGLSVCP